MSEKNYAEISCQLYFRLKISEAIKAARALFESRKSKVSAAIGLLVALLSVE